MKLILSVLFSLLLVSTAFGNNWEGLLGDNRGKNVTITYLGSGNNIITDSGLLLGEFGNAAAIGHPTGRSYIDQGRIINMFVYWPPYSATNTTNTSSTKSLSPVCPFSS